MVGHLLRYHPAFLALQDLVAAGELGAIRHIRAHRFNFGAIRREEDAAACLAPHDISMVLALLRAEPDVVDARLAYPLGRPIADMATIALAFPGGVSADISVSWLHPEKEQRLVVTGERAIAVFDDLRPWESKLTLTRLRASPDGSGPPRRMDMEPVPVTPAEPLALECRHFLEAIAGDRLPLTDGEEAMRVMTVLDRARDPRHLIVSHG
jgi:UDP-2-acetamido-3-amino-2,3-dideoxy-glucuronate N-acetyltransferase